MSHVSNNQTYSEYAVANNNPASQSEGQGYSASTSLPQDELASFLSLVERDNAYTVEAVMKKSEYEETQRVTYLDEVGHKKGPFVRKYLRCDVGLGAMYKRLFEAQRTGKHFVHLPRIYDCYQLNDMLVVIMEYVQGETLKDVVFRCDPSPELAMDVFPSLCDAVRELHEQFDPPIIHRDLKPTNIIMSFNRLTLIDFGIARTYQENMESDTVRFGTREYAPPEQFGYGQTDVRSDVYALGILLFYCFTEKTPDIQIRNAQFVSHEIPEPFREVIVQACAFDPKDRFASVQALKNAFIQASRIYEDSAAGIRKEPVLFGEQVAKAESKNKTHAKNYASVLYNQISAFMERVPTWIGRIWNVALILFWLLIVAASIAAVLSPNEFDSTLPLWFRVLEYLGFLVIAWTSCTYVVLDKRRFFKRFSKLKRFSFPVRLLIFGIGIPIALLFIVTTIGQFVVPGGWAAAAAAPH